MGECIMLLVVAVLQQRGHMSSPPAMVFTYDYVLSMSETLKILVLLMLVAILTISISTISIATKCSNSSKYDSQWLTKAKMTPMSYTGTT